MADRDVPLRYEPAERAPDSTPITTLFDGEPVLPPVHPDVAVSMHSAPLAIPNTPDGRAAYMNARLAEFERE